MNNYFIDHIELQKKEESLVHNVVFPNNTISEYVPFYSILYSGKYLNHLNLAIKHNLNNRSIKSENKFLNNILSFGIDRLMEKKRFIESVFSDLFINTTISTLKNYLKEPPNMDFIIVGLPEKKSETQNNMIEALLFNRMKSLDIYIAPLFLSTLDKVVLFTPVIKRTNVLKAKMEFIKTGVWNTAYFELWISKTWLDGSYAKIDSWLTALLKELDLDVKIVDNFKSIYSPEFKEFNTIRERKEYLLKMENEIKQNIKEECDKMYNIDLVKQKQFLDLIGAKGLYLMSDYISEVKKVKNKANIIVDKPIFDEMPF